MSTTYTLVECSGCDLTGTSAVTLGLFYNDQDRGVSVDRCTGYCATCGEIVPVEVIADTSPQLSEWDIESDREEGEEVRQQVAAARRARPWIVNWFVDHLWRTSEPDVYVPYHAESHVQVVRTWETLRAIGRAPVCLACGATGAIALTADGFCDDGTPSPTDVTHAGCGGTLRLRGSNGDRMGVEIETRLYDLMTGRQFAGPPVHVVPYVHFTAPAQPDAPRE